MLYEDAAFDAERRVEVLAPPAADEKLATRFSAGKSLANKYGISGDPQGGPVHGELRVARR